ncbi:hypothetical protein KUL25_18665 [Rhodobacteraceae bacterium N5(2021)]|uniref:Uncharacterized protein n=1 Tax=Gymnodinialimonas phycosphaerae TaxID=2841589 RepID=A0A975YFI1_9RHOB|nr:hypothetical protein [Gymnodinialimonas phycosphaerae]MBY4894784.1 hypothetical protein [Gymnodinialimonas phycosphaerae]
MVQALCTMHLPQGIAPEAHVMFGEGMAIGLLLLLLAHLVDVEHPDGARHVDQRAEIDQRVFQPARGGEATVDQ